ncbi:AAA family ATPase [Nostocales cyanobacterium LEGE 11386]|nr:AAA family ATPase [Nostocales cyanobacterium LEGE 11386]
MWQQHPNILFLSGASGVGKTTIVNALKAKNTNKSHFFIHFDSIGVPSLTEMIEQVDSGERWQEITTHKWIAKILKEYQKTDTVIIEGQVRLNFIEDACQNFGLTKYAIALIDCTWEVMQERLINIRQQPELVNSDMQNWANLLRKQALCKNIKIIDTSVYTLEEVLDILQNQVLTNLLEAEV